MKSHKSSFVFVAILIVLLLGSLYFLRQKPASLPVTTNSPAAHHTVQEKTISDKTDFYEMSATYPVDTYDTKHVIEEFVLAKINEKKEAWKKGGEVELAEKKVSQDFPDRPKMVYQYMIGYKKYSSEKFGTVSYVISLYEFSGGAHGMTNITTFTFSKNGQLAIDSLLDFAKNNNDVALTKILAKHVTSTLGENTDTQMINDGLGLSFLKSDGVTFDKAKCQCDGFFFPSNMQNFVIQDDGIMFVMSQYQVAPYAAGLPEILIPWKELEPYSINSFKVLTP
jgi:hypothetical protein